MSETRTIAGHHFIEFPSGRACSICGRTWINVLDNRDRWIVGQGGIAHTGALNEQEVAQLHAEIERIWACFG